jgi:sulfur carrier protein ThiS
MVVQMNDKEIELFSGARVRDALLKYSKDAYRSTRSGDTVVVDKNRNPVGMDGELSNGQRLYTSPVLHSPHAPHDTKTD